MGLVLPFQPAMQGSYSTYPGGLYVSGGGGILDTLPLQAGGGMGSLASEAPRAFTVPRLMPQGPSSFLGAGGFGGAASSAVPYSLPTPSMIGSTSLVPYQLPTPSMVGPTSSLGGAATWGAPTGAMFNPGAVGGAIPTAVRGGALAGGAAAGGLGSTAATAATGLARWAPSLAGQSGLGALRTIGGTALRRGTPWMIGGQVASGIAGSLWNDPDSDADDRLRTALAWGGTGAGIGATVGSIVPVIGTGIGAAIGGAGGALAGAIFGGGDDTRKEAKEEALDKIGATFYQMGAPLDFVRTARQQLELAWQVREPGNADEVNAIANEVMSGMMEMYSMGGGGGGGMEMGGGYAVSGVEAQRNYEAQIAAAQAMMEPLIQQQLQSSQTYADQFAQAQIAAANQISNPGLRDAMIAMARQGQSDMAAQNAMALQQMYATPSYLTEQMDMLYQQQIMNLQQQGLDLAAAQMQAGQGGGQMIGGVPYIGG